MARSKKVVLLAFCFVFCIAFTALTEAKDKAIEIDVDKLNTNPGHSKTAHLYVGRQDSIVWHSRRRFKVKSLVPWDEEKQKAANKDATEWYPFYRPLATMISVEDKNGRFVIATGPLRSDVRFTEAGTDYKPMFEYLNAEGQPTGDEVDPHIAAHERN